MQISAFFCVTLIHMGIFSIGSFIFPEQLVLPLNFVEKKDKFKYHAFYESYN